MSSFKEPSGIPFKDEDKRTMGEEEEPVVSKEEEDYPLEKEDLEDI